MQNDTAKKSKADFQSHFDDIVSTRLNNAKAKKLSLLINEIAGNEQIPQELVARFEESANNIWGTKSLEEKKPTKSSNGNSTKIGDISHESSNVHRGRICA